eukprot:7230613-Pyramimonas_sp.AAC.1
MAWKMSSLMFMFCGVAPRCDADGVIMSVEDLLVDMPDMPEVSRFRRVSSMNVLCVEIHSEF